MATFSSVRPTYSFTYPSSWDKEEGSSNLSPVTLSFHGGRIPRASRTLGTVALTLREVPSGSTLGPYARAMRHQLVRHGYTVVATYPTTMGRQRGLVIKYRALKWFIDFVYARFLSVKGGYAYVLTYSRPKADFGTTYRTVASVAESFRFG